MGNAVIDVRKLEKMARPDPCTGCPNNTRCRFELIACRAFEHYVHSGYFSEKLLREPTRKIFNAVFYEDDQLSLKQLRKQLRKDIQ